MDDTIDFKANKVKILHNWKSNNEWNKSKESQKEANKK